MMFVLGLSVDGFRFVAFTGNKVCDVLSRLFEIQLRGAAGIDGDRF